MFSRESSVFQLQSFKSGKKIDMVKTFFECKFFMFHFRQLMRQIQHYHEEEECTLLSSTPEMQQVCEWSEIQKGILEKKGWPIKPKKNILKE